MAQAELKPCPFCGGEAALTCHDNHYVAQCMNDMCGVSAYTELRYPQSAESAAAAWNTRCNEGAENAPSLRESGGRGAE